MEIFVEIALISLISPFLSCFQLRLIIFINYTRIASSNNRAIDDVTN